MAYGILKVDTITFTDGGVDKSVTISGLVQNPTFTGNVTVTGTISGDTVRGQTISGVTVTGTTAQFTSGTFVSLTGVTLQGTTATYTTGSFTSLTGTTTSGTTANFVSGVFSTQISGATVTGTTANFTSGNFTNISGGTHTITSGVFALGTATNPSISFTSDPNTGIYSPGADQVAISTNGTGRLTIDSSGNINIDSSTVYVDATNNRVGIGTASPGRTLVVNAQDPAIEISAASTGTYANEGIFFKVDGTDFGQIYNDGSSALVFRYNGGSGLQERMRLDSSGRLGLGTSSPAVLAHLASTASPTGQTNTPLRLTAGQTFGGEIAGYINQGVNAGLIFSTVDSGTATERIRITPTGVGIGTTSPSASLEVYRGTITVTDPNSITTGDTGTYGALWSQGANLTQAGFQIVFNTGSNNARTERARIDSSGRLLVGTSSAYAIQGFSRSHYFAPIANENNNQMVVAGINTGTPALFFTRTRGGTPTTYTVVQDGDSLGLLEFFGADGTSYGSSGARIQASVDGTPGTNDMPGRLVFSTTADGASSPTERMRITNSGAVLIGKQALSATTTGIEFEAAGFMRCVRDGNLASIFQRYSSDGDVVGFRRDNTVVGSISVTPTATAYNTSSDYRLKENVVPLTGAAARLNQLQVHRFNFIADPDKTVDGFIAHEAQAVVPECVTGTKDEVDADGNPVYQGIDQSKLVPLLTAALQEALTEIESLKARVTALEP